MSRSSRRNFLQTTAAGLAGATLPFSLQAAPDHGVVGDPDVILARRREYLEILKRLLAPTKSSYIGRMNDFDKTWEDWLERTGELPPDFLNMPSVPLLPDPFTMLESPDSEKGNEHPAGMKITTPELWKIQRERIRDGFEKWVFGKMPPPPHNTRGSIMSQRDEGDATVYHVQLLFGPRLRGRLEIELIVPKGKGPFPVFLTNHPRRRPWVNTAVRRGYVGCIFYALDPMMYRAGDDSDMWVNIYQKYDFSMIGRWAFAAMRAVDYLVRLPYVDKDRIAIGGHSRNSKSALLAAAFDERIGAVVPSRGNTGDQMPWRFTSDMFVSESIEEITGNPHWFHPRLRFFVGREDKLPIDQNLLLAMVAPRGLLMSHAYMEHQGNPLGFERSFRSVREVYRFFGKEQNLGLYQQPGEHPASVLDVENYFDFFDTVFDRKSFPVPRIWVHGYDYDKWLSLSDEKINAGDFPQRKISDSLDDATAETWRTTRSEIQNKILWTMGEEPPGIPLPESNATRSSYTNIRYGWRGQLFTRPYKTGGRIRARTAYFGDDLRGELYYPGSPELDKGKVPSRVQKWPLVIWLHPYSYNMGYSRYDYWGKLVKNGCAVLAFDQIGFGTRNDQSLRFYERYPRWSLLGKMVTDTRAALDAMMNRSFIDTDRVFLVGYALGAKVALRVAALDDRIRGVSVSCGFAPLRSAIEGGATEGIRHYSHIHGLLPRLGAFLGEESRIPVDYEEILAAIAPRPMQIVAPTMDRYNPIEEVRSAVAEARRAYKLVGDESGIDLVTPEDFNRYASVPAMQREWLLTKANLPVS